MLAYCMRVCIRIHKPCDAFESVGCFIRGLFLAWLTSTMRCTQCSRDGYKNRRSSSLYSSSSSSCSYSLSFCLGSLRALNANENVLSKTITTHKSLRLFLELLGSFLVGNLSKDEKIDMQTIKTEWRMKRKASDVQCVYVPHCVYVYKSFTMNANAWISS